MSALNTVYPKIYFSERVIKSSAVATSAKKGQPQRYSCMYYDDYVVTCILTCNCQLLFETHGFTLQGMNRQRCHESCTTKRWPLRVFFSYTKSE